MLIYVNLVKLLLLRFAVRFSTNKKHEWKDCQQDHVSKYN